MFELVDRNKESVYYRIIDRSIMKKEKTLHRLTIDIPIDLYKDMAHRAIERDVKMRQWVLEAVVMQLKREMADYKSE